MSYYPPVSPYAAGMACKCPRCGRGRLFSGFLKVADECGSCGLDYSTADSGDGPAVFLLFLVGFVAIVALAVVRFVMGAPEWVALLVSILLTVFMTLTTIRPLKATMIALQYANRAREGQLEGDDEAQNSETSDGDRL